MKESELKKQNAQLLAALKRSVDQARTFMLTDSFGLIKKKDFVQSAKNRFGAIIEEAEATIAKAEKKKKS